jgi:hypothetical protein
MVDVAFAIGAVFIIRHGAKKSSTPATRHIVPLRAALPRPGDIIKKTYRRQGLPRNGGQYFETVARAKGAPTSAALVARRPEEAGARRELLHVAGAPVVFRPLFVSGDLAVRRGFREERQNE